MMAIFNQTLAKLGATSLKTGEFKKDNEQLFVLTAE